MLLIRELLRLVSNVLRFSFSSRRILVLVAIVLVGIVAVAVTSVTVIGPVVIYPLI